jgi:hypothetical protein
MSVEIELLNLKLEIAKLENETERIKSGNIEKQMDLMQEYRSQINALIKLQGEK